jgi:hypothetical protein
MHGSSFVGDCSKALMDLDEVMKEVWGEKLSTPGARNYVNTEREP